MSSHRRGPWSQGEDAYLVQLVHTQGALNWVRIAQLIGSRSPKQCRERYHQNLKPSLNHEPISPEEGMQIERMVGEMGKRWAEIARRLHGRSDNAVKNWWNGSMNRRRRLVLRRRTSHGGPSNSSGTNFDERVQPLSFARPAAHGPLTITATHHYTHRRGGDGPLPSPAVSEASRAESMEGAPSLVSDTSSRFSISPRMAKSPIIELPPLQLPSSAQSARRPSVPTLPFRPNAFLAEGESPAYTFTPRFMGDAKVNPVYHRPERAGAATLHSPRDYRGDPRSQISTAPSTPVHQIQLAPIQMAAGPEVSFDRDSRMHLSALLR